MLRSRARDLVLLFAVLALVAACGSSSGGSANGTSDGDDSEATQSEATPGSDDGDDNGSDDGSDDGDDNGSTGSFDLDRAFDALTPPNANELSKTTADGIIFAAWDTDDSFDSLRSFYESAIDDLGLDVISTTEAQGGIAWVVADSGGSGAGGTVSIFPASDGSGTQVSVTIGEDAS